MDIINRGTIATTPGDVPDYSAPKPLGVVPIGPIYTSTDIGELAARLGSPDTFDRRGNIILLETFGDSLSKWLPGSDGDAGSVEIVNKYSRSGPFAVKLVTPNVADARTWLQGSFAVPVLSKIGFEFSFSTNCLGFRVRLDMELSAAGMYYYSDIYWDADTQKLTYLNESDNWVTLPDTFKTKFSLYHFNTIKLVTDFAHSKYNRIIWNDQVVDLSTIPLKQGATLEPPYLYILLHIQNAPTLLRTAYIDNVIITQNEP